MEEVKSSFTDLPFNGLIETGVRAVLNLHVCFPKSLDVQKLTALDYLIVRTQLLDGPLDLHPATPITTPITQVRRRIVQDALQLMMARGLVSQVVTREGIFYQAGENSAFFVDALQSVYLQELLERAQWLSSYCHNTSDQDFDERMKVILSDWISEFQDEVGVFGDDA